MNFSLKSRLNLIVVCILAFLVLAAALQIAISKFLLQSKPLLTKYLIESFGYTIKLDGISFSWLRGIHLKGLSFFYRQDDTAVVYLKDASITLRLLPLFLKKLSINRININDATLSLKKGDGGVNLQIIFSDIYKNLCESKSAKFQIDIRNLSIYTRYATLIYADEESSIKGAKLFFRNARIDIYKSEKLNFKSELKFTQQIPKGHYLFRFLNREAIEQDLKCALQATLLSNQDLNIDMFLINLAKEQIIGMGRIKDSLGRNPEVNIIFIPSTLSLGSITFLKDNFSPEGQMLVSLKFLGKMDDIKPWISANLDNCNFSYHVTNNEIFDIENMNGKIEYIDGSIKLENIFLKLNSVPLNITLETNVSQEPSILLRVALPQEFLLAQKLPIENLEANFKGRLKNTLTGELDIKTLYRRMDSVFQMQAYFKNLDFDYRNLQEKYLRCDSLTLIKNDGVNLQKLNFINFDSKAILTKNRLNLKDISFTGYNGAVGADINIGLKDKPVLSFTIEGQGLDIKKIMSDTHITKKLLSGTLDIEIAFNNSLKEFLKGTCTVKDGLMDLSALSEGIKLPPLKNLNFEAVKLSFALSKELISIRDVKLTSADILINAYWQISRAVNGELGLEISSKFLNTSVQFKKLLSLTRIKKPYIDFKFLLGGVPEAIRFMWMKGEFKEKIEGALPTGIKKSIEANLDEMVEGLSNK